ncbi:MAG TPA: glutamate--tRNA ligase [Candidatus Saccharimonadales bacterium]|nr:glutamate--tRNA ligase [Candidatus Saccharimonadales bacterium]
MISDEKFVNTIKLIALKNAIEFDNKIKLDVVISRAFSFSKFIAGENHDLKSYIPDIKTIVSELQSLSIDDKKKLYTDILSRGNDYLDEKKKSYIEKHHQDDERIIKQNQEIPVKGSKSKGQILEFDLPHLEDAVDGKVVTRFPPEPNGYPHIGHAKAAVIDEEYAKKYKGKLILRYDDTNPLKEKIEYYDAIKEGLDWLGVKPQIIKNTSDDIEKLYDYARQLIRKNFAYICNCAPETIKKNRINSITCDCASHSLDENLRSFDALIRGDHNKESSAILRYRGNMSSLNTAMRDPTLFRVIKDGNHPRVGSKYFLWPTYDFAAPIEDSLDGITHALRTKEYELRNELYYSILDNLDLPKPRLIEFSRLEFEGIPVSKRKITPLIEQGIIKRWDDPRLPTLMGLRRRGILPQAIRKFVMSLSITLSETKPSIEILESFNRKLLDPISPRLFFVKDPVKVFIKSFDVESVEIKNHPTIDMGKRMVNVKNIIYISNDDANRIKTGDTLRLMDLCNIEILSIERSKDEDVGGNNNDSVIYALNKGNEVSHKIPKVQWVSEIDQIKYKIMRPLPLYNGEKYNENNLVIDNGVAESFVSKLPIGTAFQFVRYGFCRTDDQTTAIFTHR